jgi:limonene 1,2-monooxygenase
MKFGIFLAPFHQPGQDPALAYERDLELIERLDELGFNEAFVGEHHSAGWEIIPAPEIFIATAAARTRRITLGAGVVSVPYHHPFHIANRYAMLDQITRGRIILGCGPGALPGDAYMLGIDPTIQRKRLIEGVKVIVRLFTENVPISVEGSWFMLQEAHLQIKPYQRPHMPIFLASMYSPSGMVAAGELGTGLLTLLGFVRGFGALGERWKIVEETAAEHGKVVKRENWRLVLPFHLAESRKEAFDNVREVANTMIQNYLYVPPDDKQKFGTTIRGATIEEIADQGGALVGTPDDAIAKIRELQEISGGFGGFLDMTIDWATPEKTLRSFELFARYVAPVFTNSIDSIRFSWDWTVERREKLRSRVTAGLSQATDEYLQKKTPQN